MDFWALAYQYQEDVFYNFENEDDVMDLDEKCLLPCEDLAKEIIEDKLSDDYVPVKITLKSVQPNGIWSYERDTVKRWDEDE
jgi:hypothetical protein